MRPVGGLAQPQQLVGKAALRQGQLGAAQAADHRAARLVDELQRQHNLVRAPRRGRAHAGGSVVMAMITHGMQMSSAARPPIIGAPVSRAHAGVSQL